MGAVEGAQDAPLGFAVRAKARARGIFKRHVAAWLWVRSRDTWALWSLPSPDPQDGPSVDIMRLGSCEDRAMWRVHRADSPLGVPRFLALELARQGVRTGYQNVWAWSFEDLPQDERMLRKRRRLNRPAPDVVLVQAGPIYTGRHYLGGHPRVLGMRENLGGRVGVLIYPIWRVIAKSQRIAAFPTIPYLGTEHLERFLEVGQEVWPDTVFVLYEPTNAILEGPMNRVELERITADMRAVVARQGDRVRMLPRPELGLDWRLRISNSLNTNESGARIVGRHFADWILEQGDIVRRPEQDTARESNSHAG